MTLVAESVSSIAAVNTYASGSYASGWRKVVEWVHQESPMNMRLAMWASAGFLVAGFWALFALATFPSTNERIQDVWTLLSLTCPVAIIGRHYPMSLHEVLAANAATYALGGLLIESLRRHPRHAK